MLIIGGNEGENITGNLLDELGYDASLYSIISNTFTTSFNATITISSNGDYTYTPPIGQSGRDNFSFSIQNNSTGIIQSIQNAQVTIESTNLPQSYTAQQGITHDVIIANTIYNAYDGGDGADTLNFLYATQAIDVDLTRSLAFNDGFGERDSIVNIENIYGSSFNDVIISDENSNIIDGQGGDDKLYGFFGADIVYGGTGNDLIYADGKYANDADGNDTVHGGEGNDTVFANGGDDMVYSDQGNDRLYGGTGVDTLNYSNETSGVYAHLHQEKAIDGLGGRDTINSFENVIGSHFDDRLYGGDDNSVIDGLGGDDVIYGHLGLDILTGGDGNDLIYGDLKAQSSEDADDTIFGDAGDDEIFGQGGNDTIDGGADNDRINAGNGQDIVNGGSGRDIIYGDNEIEQIDDGADILDGGDDEDLIYGGGGNDVIYGGGGSDRTAWSGSTKLYNGGLFGGSGDDSIYGQGGDDYIEGNEGNDLLDGGSEDDIIYGGSGLDTIQGGDGNDTLYGEDGDDHLRGGTGADKIFGGSGIDTVDFSNDVDSVEVDLLTKSIAYTSTGRDYIYDVENVIGSDFADRLTANEGVNIVHGGLGNDVIFGVGAADTLYGEDGDDIIYGDRAVNAAEDGDDIIYGGAGDDTLYGGGGDDTFIGGDGGDKIFGGDGIDTIDYSAETARVEVDLDWKFIAYTSTGRDLIYEVENIIGTDFDDRITGNDADNILTGGAGRDRLFGSAGSDVIYGGDGNDILHGDWKDVEADDGNDTIYGGNGDDYIIGLGGNDLLFGDAGNDIFIWDAGDTYHGGDDYDIIYLAKSNIGNVLSSEITGSGIEHIALDNYRGDGSVANTLNLDVSDLTGLANNNNITITGDAGQDTIIADDIDTAADLVDIFEIDGVLFEQFSVSGLSISIQQGLLQNAVNGDIVIGTDNADILNGTNQDNIILGKAGDDIIQGLNGEDRISGDDGADTISGDKGNDILIGGRGDDEIYGGADDDILYATSRPWFDADWTHRQTITIDSDAINSDLSDFTLHISGEHFGDDFWNTVQLDGRDILITDSENNTIYTTDILHFDTASRSMDIYVNIDDISSTTNTTLNIYYGNASALSAQGDAWGNGYVGVWHLDDDYSAANIVSDSSGNNNNGAALQNFSGTDEVVDGAVGAALQFNNSEYIALNHSYAANTYLPSVSVSAWVNTTYSHSGYNENWSILDYDRSEFFNVYIHGNGQLAFSTNSDGNGGIHDMEAGPAINDGEWHHIVAVYDGNDKILYVDGIEVGRESGVHNGAGLGSNLTRFGYIGDGSEADSFDGGRNNKYYNGQVDEVKLYEGVLSADEIAAEYNNITNSEAFYSVSSSADIYDGGDDIDLLYGEAGDDILYASSGADTLDGGAGSDTLFGGSDSNALYGGSGDDVVYADAIASGSTTTLSADLANGISAMNPDGYWRLNQISGSNVSNLGAGGASIDGTINGTPTLGAAALYGGGGTSIQFDGIDDYIEIPDSSLINTQAVAQRSIEIVFNADVTSGRHVLYEEGGNVNALTIYIDNGELYFHVFDKDDFGPYDIKAAINVDETYHAALVFDASAGNFVGYLNGQIVGSGAVTQNLSAHSGDVAIGAQHDSNYYHDGPGTGGVKHFFQGRISDVALYNEALDQGEIQAHVNAMNGDLNGAAGAIDDVLYGGDGFDQLFGGEGRDVFVFEAASAFNDIDEINNFSAADFDTLNISDLLTGWVSGDPVQGDINNFVQLYEVGGNTIVSVDSTGSGSNFTAVAQINDVTGINASLLYNNDMLIVE